MRRFGLFGFLAAGLATASVAQGQEPTFDFGFAGGLACGGQVEGFVAGAPIAADPVRLDCTITTNNAPGADGAQGFSMSMASEGIDIVSVTTEGTVSADVAQGGIRNTGFEKSELTLPLGAGRCPGGFDGAVSAVVFSFTMPITLAATGTIPVARIEVQGGSFPDTIGECSSARVFYVDNCRGIGEPVENAVTWRGGTIRPNLGECAVEACLVEPPPACPIPEATGVQIILQTAVTGQTGEVFAAAAPTPNGTENPAEIDLAPGEATVYAAIVSQGLASGVQGWSVGASVSGVTLVDATTSGTVGAESTMGGLRNTGFEKTELIDPELNGQGPGTVSAVVLSFTMPITLNTTGTATILCIRVSGALGDSGQIVWRNGLQGIGQPVDTVATINGGTAEYVCCQSGNVNFAQPPEEFASAGESNGDGRIDLADGIFIVNNLFRGGEDPPCVAAMDADGDGIVTLADALFVVDYLFRSGPAPAGASGECRSVDPSLCAESSPSCG